MGSTRPSHHVEVITLREDAAVYKTQIKRKVLSAFIFPDKSW
jgi:hypothetical protein